VSAAGRHSTFTEPAGALFEQGPRPELLFFFSVKSGSSRRVEGFLAQVLQRRGNHRTFELRHIDADDQPDMLERFGVTEVPTLLVIDDGRTGEPLANPRGCREISELLAPWLK
jgi:thioredoxin-like negative regulator of GroEL